MTLDASCWVLSVLYLGSERHPVEVVRTIASVATAALSSIRWVLFLQFRRRFVDLDIDIVVFEEDLMMVVPLSVSPVLDRSGSVNENEPCADRVDLDRPDRMVASSLTCG